MTDKSDLNSPSLSRPERTNTGSSAVDFILFLWEMEELETSLISDATVLGTQRQFVAAQTLNCHDKTVPSCVDCGSNERRGASTAVRRGWSEVDGRRCVCCKKKKEKKRAVPVWYWWLSCALCKAFGLSVPIPTKHAVLSGTKKSQCADGGVSSVQEETTDRKMGNKSTAQLCEKVASGWKMLRLLNRQREMSNRGGLCSGGPNTQPTESGGGPLTCSGSPSPPPSWVCRRWYSSSRPNQTYQTTAALRPRCSYQSTERSKTPCSLAERGSVWHPWRASEHFTKKQN